MPTVVCSTSELLQTISRNCPIFTSKYWPTLLVPNGSMQWFAYEALARIRIGYQDPASAWTREKLLSKAGHGITLDQAVDPKRGPLPDKAHIALLLNSSSSGSHSYESITLGEQLRDLGLRVYALNLRGTANADLKAVGDAKPAFNTLSDPTDLREALLFLAKRHKGVSLSVISFGTASAMVLNYLNSAGKDALVESAVCISPAMHMESLAEMGYMQNKIELDKVKREVLMRHANVLETVLGQNEVKAALETTTVADFHQAVTMKACGDEPDDSSYADYLRAHSVTKLGDGIQRPVLCICSKDDPVYNFKKTVPPEIVRQFKAHKYAMLCVIRGGGHKLFCESMTVRATACATASEQPVNPLLALRRPKIGRLAPPSSLFVRPHGFANKGKKASNATHFE